MRILLTGASGFLGKELYKKLKSLGHTVIGLSRHGPDISCDITDPCLDIACSYHIDVLLHSAALLSFSKAQEKEIFRVNTGGTANLLKIVNHYGISRVVFISTAYVCGDINSYWRPDQFDLGQNFKNPYEESKFRAEKLVRELGSNVTKTIFRPSIIVGNSSNGEATDFDGFYRPVKAMAKMMKLAERGIGLPLRERSEEVLRLPEMHLPISINGDPDSTLNLVPIDWVVENISENLLKEGTFHLTCSSPMTNKQIIEATNRALGINGPHFVKDYHGRGPQDIFYNRMIRDFLPYLRNEPRFISFGEVGSLTSVSEELIIKLIKYWRGTQGEEVYGG